MEEASVRWMFLVASLLVGFVGPVRAQVPDSRCVQRFEACAIACAVLGKRANNGCLGACLRDNGCAIDDDNDGTSSASMPDSTLPGDTLPKGRLPGNRMPSGSLPDSRMP